MVAPLQRKNRGNLCLEAVLLLCPAAIFAVSGDAPHTFILALVGLLASLAMPQPLPRNTRSFVYAGVSALTVTALADMILPVSPDRFFLMPAHIYCPLIIFIGVTATFFDQRDSNLTAVIALSLLGTMLAGNTLAAIVYRPRLPFANKLLAHFHPFYGTVVAVQLLTMLVLLCRVDRRVPEPPTLKRRRLARRAILVVTVLTVAAGTLGLRQTAMYYERTVQHTFSRLFRLYLLRQAHWIVFGDTVSLWQTVPYRSSADKAVVFRVTGRHAPGYMRGRVFTRYEAGRWMEILPGGNLRADRPGGRFAFARFQRDMSAVQSPDTPRDETGQMHVFPVARVRGDVLLAPGNTDLFELVTPGLSNGGDGVLTASGWDPRAGYSMTPAAGLRNPAYPYPLLDADDSDTYLRVPPALTQKLRRILTEEVGVNDDGEPTQAVIAKLVRYFRRHFTYELGVRMEMEGGDPVLQFLEQHHKGHCELFAAATVLLLRVNGTPARYVTGFVCAEPHPGGTHWISRLEDAHAWVEAYLPEDNRWVLVEPTPDAGMPPITSDCNLFTAMKERVLVFWHYLLARLKRGYVAETIADAALTMLRWLWWLVNHPIRGPLAMLALFYLGRRFQRRRQARATQEKRLLEPTRLELRRTLNLVETHVRKSLGIMRAPSDTVREFGNVVRRVADAAQAGVVLEVLHEYEQLRYQGTAPSSEIVRRFRHKVKRQLACTKRR